MSSPLRIFCVVCAATQTSRVHLLVESNHIGDILFCPDHEDPRDPRRVRKQHFNREVCDACVKKREREAESSESESQSQSTRLCKNLVSG